MAATFERRSEEDLQRFSRNFDANQSLAQRFGIRSIPTLVLFKDGVEADRMSGAMSAADLKRWIAAH